MKSRIKLIALDLDGTTLNNNAEVDEKTQFAIEKAEKAGYLVCFATGRSFNSACRYTNIINLEDNHDHYIVCDNGASIIRTGKQEYVYRITKDYDFWKPAIDFLTKAKLPFYFYQDALSNDPFSEIVVGATNKKNIHLPHFTNSPYSVTSEKCDILPFSEIAKYWKQQNFQTPKIILPHSISLSVFQYIYDHLHGSYHIFRSHERYTEFMPKGVNKAYGLGNLAAMLNLSSENVLAVGDNNNDLEMLEWAGLSFTPSNGSQQAKEVADFTTKKSNDEDAVAHIIEFWIL